MQTFLPYTDFYLSAQCLDQKRLGNQRVEVLQILNALAGKSKGWVNHPAVKMWKGYEQSLGLYGNCICQEWTARGFKDTCSDKIQNVVLEIIASRDQGVLPFEPDWLYDPRVIQSHRSSLLNKDWNHYSKFNWNTPTNIPLYWPR